MTAKHVFTAANVISALYRCAYTGVLFYHLALRLRGQGRGRSGSGGQHVR